METKAKNDAESKGLKNGTVFEVKRAMIGLETGETDNAVLDYLDLFTQKITISALYFLHVFRQNSLLRTYYETQTSMILGQYNLEESFIQDLEEKVKGHLSKSKSIDITVETKEGSPLEELLKGANSIKADLIIIGQNTSTIHHNILARNFIKMAPCNALVIPDQSKPQLNRLLVPIDFSPYSIKALQTALSISQQQKQPMDIICLNLYELPNTGYLESEDTLAKIGQILIKDRQKAFAHLLETHITDNELRNHIQTAILPKNNLSLGEQIIQYAKAKDIDLIIMGAKGHSKLKALLAG